MRVGQSESRAEWSVGQSASWTRRQLVCVNRLEYCWSI